MKASVEQFCWPPPHPAAIIVTNATMARIRCQTLVDMCPEDEADATPPIHGEERAVLTARRGAGHACLPIQGIGGTRRAKPARRNARGMKRNAKQTRTSALTGAP